MKPPLIKALRSRAFMGGCLAGLFILLALALAGLRGKRPVYQELASLPAPPQSPAPVGSLERLFSPGAWPKPLAASNAVSAFYTTHFIPPPAPAPPAPTTRRIELVYHGFFEAGAGPKTVIVRMGDAFLNAPLGSRLTANLYAAEASMASLVLTNPAAATNLLKLNTKKEIEVPIQ
jgi:hypothetical protein